MCFVRRNRSLRAAVAFYDLAKPKGGGGDGSRWVKGWRQCYGVVVWCFTLSRKKDAGRRGGWWQFPMAMKGSLGLFFRLNTTRRRCGGAVLRRAAARWVLRGWVATVWRWCGCCFEPAAANEGVCGLFYKRQRWGMAWMEVETVRGGCGSGGRYGMRVGVSLSCFWQQKSEGGGGFTSSKPGGGDTGCVRVAGNVMVVMVTGWMMV